MKRGIQLQASLHAKQRIKERMGVEDKREIKELVKSAYHKGLCMKKNYIPRATLWYVDRKVNNYFGRASQWRIYKGHLFLFNKTLTLLTVYELPKHLVPQKELKRF